MASAIILALSGTHAGRFCLESSGEPVDEGGGGGGGGGRVRPGQRWWYRGDGEVERCHVDGTRDVLEAATEDR